MSTVKIRLRSSTERSCCRQMRLTTALLRSTSASRTLSSTGSRDDCARRTERGDTTRQSVSKSRVRFPMSTNISLLTLERDSSGRKQRSRAAREDIWLVMAQDTAYLMVIGLERIQFASVSRFWHVFDSRRSSTYFFHSHRLPATERHRQRSNHRRQ
jgi:hypothetical protein